MGRTSLAALLICALTACPPKAPPAPAIKVRQPSEAATARIPPGCGVDLGGPWVHLSSSNFRYLGSDDGGSLILRLQRGPSEGTDGGVSSAPTLVLQRTPDGFRGTTQAIGFNAAGQACPVEFPTEVLGCEDGGLSLRSATRTSVDEACRPPEKAPPSPMVIHRLAREADGGGVTW